MRSQGQAGRRGEGWISIEEREPAVKDQVLTYNPKDDRLYIASLCPSNAGGLLWYRDGWDSPIARPTHWMPLPAPPVADGEEGDDE